FGQRGARTPAILPADRMPECLLAEVMASAPIAGYPAKRGEPGARAVRSDPGAVDAGAAHHRHPPRSARSGAQQREGVVADLDRVGPALGRERHRQRFFLHGEVGAGHVSRQVAGQRLAVVQAELGPDDGHRPRGHRDRSCHAARLWGEPAGARARDHLPFVVHEQYIGLAVPAVDGEHGSGPGHLLPGSPRRLRLVGAHGHLGSTHGRCCALAAISASASLSARSICPISGCASSAPNTRSRPPWIAASSASSSYALTCAISPRRVAGRVDCGKGSTPDPLTVAETSITASSSRNGSVPSLRTLTTCTSPFPPTSDASNCTAAS